MRYIYHLILRYAFEIYFYVFLDITCLLSSYMHETCVFTHRLQMHMNVSENIILSHKILYKSLDYIE
jgi:hypothetical protein